MINEMESIDFDAQANGLTEIGVRLLEEAHTDTRPRATVGRTGREEEFDNVLPAMELEGADEISAIGRAIAEAAIPVDKEKHEDKISQEDQMSHGAGILAMAFNQLPSSYGRSEERQRADELEPLEQPHGDQKSKAPDRHSSPTIESILRSAGVTSSETDDILQRIRSLIDGPKLTNPIGEIGPLRKLDWAKWLEQK